MKQKVFRTPEDLADHVIASATFRRNLYEMIPAGSRRILDFGCGAGGFLLRLMRDKACTELYGVETDAAVSGHLKHFLAGLWDMDLEREEADLGPEYQGFFEHIVVHDVLEHLHDPWYTLEKLRGYMAPNGRLLLATPNLQHWEFLHQILNGQFPYGHGLWHVGHIRWYTFASLLELLTLTGYHVDLLGLEIPYEVDAEALGRLSGIRAVQLPPREIQAQFPDLSPLTLHYAEDISSAYPVFLAHKLIAVCRHGSRPARPRRMGNDGARLVAQRRLTDLRLSMTTPPPLAPLCGPWC